MSTIPLEGAFIGACLFDHHKFTRFEPRLQSIEAEWTTIQNHSQRFPEEGNVFCLERGSALIGELRQFKVVANERYRPGAVPDKFMAVEINEPLELIDFTLKRDPEGIRRIFVEEGLSLKYRPTSNVVVALSKSNCIRLQLRQDDQGLWRPSHLSNLRSLDVLELDPRVFLSEVIDGRSFVPPKLTPMKVIGRVDWSLNSDFLSNVFRDLRRASAFLPGTETFNLTKGAIDRLALALNTGGLISSDPLQSQATTTRLKTFLPSLKTNTSGVQELVELLLQSPAIKQELSDRIDSATQNQVETLRAELMPSIKEEIENNFAQTIEARDTAQNELVDIQKNIETSKEENIRLSSERDELHKLINVDMSVLTAQTEAFNKAITLGTRLINRDETSCSLTDSTVLSPFTTSADRIRGTKALIELSDLTEILSEADRASGLEEGVLLKFDALLRACEIPLLFGPNAELILSSYSQAVVTSRLWRTPIDPSCISLVDVWHQPSTGKVTSFNLAWHEAMENPSRYVLAILDDLDSVTMGSWLTRFANMLRSDIKPANLLVAATLLENANPSNVSSRQALSVGIPFEARTTPGSVSAAVLRASGITRAPDQYELKAALKTSPPHDVIVDFIASINALPHINVDVAQRSTRIFVAARSTMPEIEAKEFSLDVAQTLLLSTSNLGTSHTSTSFAAFNARFNGHGT